MDQLEKESRAEEDHIRTRIQDLIKRHYDGNGWSHSRLFGDTRSDYQNYDDWSLDRVNNIINSIGSALSKANYPSKDVPGSESASKSAIDTAKEFAAGFTGDFSLTIARVTALITGVLSQFASKSSATQKSVLQDLPMSGGLHLFFGCSGSVYERSQFFTHQFIGSFQIVFESHVSADEAKFITMQQILATTQREVESLNKQVEDIRAVQVAELQKILDKRPVDYNLWKATKAGFNLMIDDLKADRDKVQLEYDKYKQVTDTIDEVLTSLDLSEFGRLSQTSEPIKLELLFSGWELDLARRYVSEQLAAVGEPVPA
ncbi:MAG TPA: hypothetical protein VMB05_15105 [Solirubrobacteraceae bacterium]|nr:hypothetical protein [Solirubrobacteraceae bacterium]